MTLDEFLARLRATPRTWEVVGDAHGWISQERAGHEMCPLSSVALDVLGPEGLLTPEGPVTPTVNRWLMAGVQMGLDAVAATEIAVSSDGGWGHGRMDDFDRPLRAQLLAACGLEEKA